MSTSNGCPAFARRRVAFLNAAGHCVYPPGIAVVPPAQLQEFQEKTSALLKAGHGAGHEDPFLAYYSCPISVTLRPLAGKKRLQETHHYQQRLLQLLHEPPSQPQWPSSSSMLGGPPSGGHSTATPPVAPAGGKLVDLLNSDSDVSLPPSDAEGGANSHREHAQEVLEGLAYWLNPRVWAVFFEIPDPKGLAPDSQWHQMEENAQLENFVNSAAGQALFHPANPYLEARHALLCRISDSVVLNAASELANHGGFPGSALPRVGSLLSEAQTVLISHSIFRKVHSPILPGERGCCDGCIDSADLDGNETADAADHGASGKGASNSKGKGGVNSYSWRLYCPCRAQHPGSGNGSSNSGNTSGITPLGHAGGKSYLFHFLKDEYLLLEWRSVSRTSPRLVAPVTELPVVAPHSPLAHPTSPGGRGAKCSAPHGKSSAARAEARQPAHTNSAMARDVDPVQKGSRGDTGAHSRAYTEDGVSPAHTVRPPAVRPVHVKPKARGDSTAAKKSRTPGHWRRVSAAADGERTAATAPPRASAPSICDECGATESCVWRQDQQCPTRRLCNACGLRLSRYQRKIRRLDAMIAASSAAAEAAASSPTLPDAVPC